MQNVLSLYKPVGATPLQLIEEYRTRHPEYRTSRLGYAGRLDPMAEGLLLVLLDDENFKRKSYELLPKTYEFDVLLGVQSDTYDVLGVITENKLNDVLGLHVSNRLLDLLPSYIGSHKQPYPPYSAPRVKGKPLFWWARENRLNEITIPSKGITIFSLELKQVTHMEITGLYRQITTNIDKVRGDFRQQKIQKSWANVLQQSSNVTPLIATLTTTCSSGTYVRSIAHELGQSLGLGAIATRIKRTQIGEFTIENAERVNFE